MHFVIDTSRWRILNYGKGHPLLLNSEGFSNTQGIFARHVIPEQYHYDRLYDMPCIDYVKEKIELLNFVNKKDGKLKPTMFARELYEAEQTFSAEKTCSFAVEAKIEAIASCYGHTVEFIGKYYV